jgi:hypothetical protein
MTEPAAGWSASRNRHTNDALSLPRLGWCPQHISGLASPREGAVVDLVVGSDRKPGTELPITCPQLSVGVRYQPSDHGPQTDKSARASISDPAIRPPRYPLVSS